MTREEIVDGHKPKTTLLPRNDTTVVTTSGGQTEA